MENIKKQFGKKVCELRKKLGISQEQLGNISKIHRTYISEIERGEANITLEHIGRLSSALGVHIKDLFTF